MLTRPSSTNSKKPLNTPTTNVLKKPVAAKCFICNQMFHQQSSFDLHMDQHQKKVNKNLPEEIQRKTAQSFGLKRKDSLSKKNSTLEAINLNQTKDKKILNKTMKLPLITIEPLQNPFGSKQSLSRGSMAKKPTSKPEQITKKQEPKRQVSESPTKLYLGDEKEIAQIDEAIKESSKLMSQMAIMTQRFENQSGIYLTQSTKYQFEEEQEDKNEDKIEKNVPGHYFIQQMHKNNWSLTKIQQEILKVDFSNYQSLQNCQIQIEFLKEVAKLSTDSKSLESVSKTKSKILAQVVKIVMIEKDQQINQKMKKESQGDQEVKQIQNTDPRTCCECLDSISFGQKCIMRGSQSYHKDCFQ